MMGETIPKITNYVSLDDNKKVSPGAFHFLTLM